MKERAPAPHRRPHGFMPGRLRDLRGWKAPVEAYDSPQIVGMDLNLQQSASPQHPEDDGCLVTARMRARTLSP